MRKKEVIILVLFAFIFFLIFANLNFADSSSQKIDARILKEVREKGNVRVIITTKNASADSIISSDGLRGKIKKYSTFNGMSLEVDENGLEKLGRDNKINSIEINQPRKLFLQLAVPLINATSAWDLKIGGINVTGEGETVCIIDTGVNASHPDLAGKVINQHCFCSANPPDRTINCCPNGLAEDTNAEDFHGHGTHVAGIIAANGTIKGVAPDAKIVAVRTFGESDHLAYDNDIISAIDYCVANSEEYNISVISMSLGGGTYENYCDNIYTGYASSINAAVAKNISVIIASGNDGNTTAISSPACIENATSVGMTYDADVGGKGWGVCTDSSTYADKIVCLSDRNSITDLFAPGAFINSTWINGGWAILSGTSMATPMVAGAFALIRQDYTLRFGKTISPYEIQSILNKTGKRINDENGSGLNFSRIDVYSAIISLNNIPPYIAFISPLNRTYSPYSVIVNITNSSDAVYVWWNNGTANLTYINPVELSLKEGNYTFYAYANNSLNSINSTSVNFSVAMPILNISLVAPINSTNISYGRFFNISVNASCSNADCGEINVSASINDNGTIELINTTEGAIPFYTNESNPRIINLDKDESEVVLFYVNVTGTVGENYTFFVDANISFNMSISSASQASLSIQEYTCEENWSCSEWSECSDNLQTRSCTDDNICGTEVSKPGLSRACDSGSSRGGGGTPRIINNSVNTSQNVTTNIPVNVSSNSGDENKSTSRNMLEEGSKTKDSKAYILYAAGIAIIAVISILLIMLHKGRKTRWKIKGKKKKT